MNKKTFAVAIVGVLFIGIFIGLYLQDESVAYVDKPTVNILEEEISVATTYESRNLVGSSSVTCTYPQTVGANRVDGVVKHALPVKETSPLTFTFQGVGDDQAILSYLDATKSITTVPITKIDEELGRMSYVELSDSQMTVHTLFLDDGIASYTKNLEIFGVQITTLAMGSCR